MNDMLNDFFNIYKKEKVHDLQIYVFSHALSLFICYNLSSF